MTKGEGFMVVNSRAHHAPHLGARPRASNIPVNIVL